MGPLSMFYYLLTEVAGFRLDVRCNLLAVMRIIIMTAEEKRQAQIALTHLTDKHDKTIKG